jgi:hypothetical protein
MSRQLKLAELRAKTDRQLVILIRSALDDALRSRAAAERAYSQVLTLLPAVRDVTETERRCLESKLARLRETLREQLAGTTGLPHESVCPTPVAPSVSIL